MLSDSLRMRFDVDRAVLAYLAAVFLTFAAFYYLDDVTANVASSRSADNTVVPILRDFGFEHVPAISYIDLVDVFDWVLIGFTFAYVVVFVPAPLYVLSQALITNTLVNIARITTVATTSFPDPRVGCERIVTNPFTSVALHRCGDDMFSGHSAIYAICAMVFYTYGWNVSHSRRVYALHLAVRWMVFAAAVAGSLLIIANRTHYTIDVLVAWYVAMGAWYGQLWWWTRTGLRIKALERLYWPHGQHWDATGGWTDAATDAVV